MNRDIMVLGEKKKINGSHGSIIYLLQALVVDFLLKTSVKMAKRGDKQTHRRTLRTID